METKEYYFEKMKKILDDINIRINKLKEKMNNSAKEFIVKNQAGRGS
jgi:division protein CdvB (Snf7/Vps24/ESCRT-III family)